MDRFDDLSGLQRGFERADDKLLHRDRAATCAAPQCQYRAQRRERGDPVRRRIRMAKRSAHRAAIAHGPIGDIGGDALHRAARDIWRTAILDICVGDAGAQHEFVAPTLGLLEFGNRGDIDDHLRLHQPQIEHRPERLPAGDDLDGVVGLAQHGQRGLQIAGTFIAERRRFHAAGLSASRAARIASTTRYGVTGDCISSTPSGRSASLSALTIAAGGAMAPPSPMPLTPNWV